MAINSPKAITEGYIEASVGKAAAPASKLFVLGIGAGLLIGMGAVVSSTAAHGLDNAGMVRMVSGLLFPVGLIMVILVGTELFTGNALMVTAAIRGRIDTLEGLKENVICGHLIPAGTGQREYEKLIVTSAEDYERMTQR